jgi:hypothetical protein
MKTYYECTDCQHCADFDAGWRVICTEPSLLPESTCNFLPVSDSDAAECPKFTEGNSVNLPWGMFVEAEKFSIATEGEVTYNGILTWVKAWMEQHPTPNTD